MIAEELSPKILSHFNDETEYHCFLFNNYTYISNGKVKKIIKLNRDGNPVCTYHTRFLVGSFDYCSKAKQFIAASPQFINSFILFDSSFNFLKRIYIPPNFYNNDSIDTVSCNSFNDIVCIKKKSNEFSYSIFKNNFQ